jgi:hypothetical protein
MGVDGLPMGVDEVPMGIDGLSMGVDGLQMSPLDYPMGVDGLPIGIDGQFINFADPEGHGGFQDQWNGLIDEPLSMDLFTVDSALMAPVVAPFGWDELLDV